VPTAPLTRRDLPSGESEAEGKHDSSGSAVSASEKEYDIVDIDSDAGSGPPYTPLTIALQGTLQKSHLHIWTDMNVIMHQMSSIEPSSRKKKKSSKAPGYVVAGTAYSLPELHNNQDSSSSKKMAAADEDSSIIENARNPWTAGHGSKVIRAEPFTFRFRVTWVSGADSLGWTITSSSTSSSSSFFSKLILFIMAAGIGALAASYWERRIRHAGVWKGDGILGRPVYGGNNGNGNGNGGSHLRSTSGVTYGNSGRVNGYGGFAQQGINTHVAGNLSGNTNAAAGGYGFGGGYGKKD
jgi:hypothetical protein